MSIIRQTEIALFADDIMFCSSHKNINCVIANLQSKINTTIPWFKKWGLNLNVSNWQCLLDPTKKKKKKQAKIKQYSGTTIAW